MQPQSSPPDTVESGHPRSRNNSKDRCHTWCKTTGLIRGRLRRSATAHGKLSPAVDVLKEKWKLHRKPALRVFRTKRSLGRATRAMRGTRSSADHPWRVDLPSHRQESK